MHHMSWVYINPSGEKGLDKIVIRTDGGCYWPGWYLLTWWIWWMQMTKSVGMCTHLDICFFRSVPEVYPRRGNVNPFFFCSTRGLIAIQIDRFTFSFPIVSAVLVGCITPESDPYHWYIQTWTQFGSVFLFYIIVLMAINYIEPLDLKVRLW